MIHFPFQSIVDVTLDASLLEQDLKGAQSIDNVSLGQICLYYSSVLKLRYVPYDQIQWAYLRAEENRMSMCCGKTFVDIWYLLLYADGNQVAKIEFQKKETAKKALAMLSEANKEMLIGYSEENKKQVLG